MSALDAIAYVVVDVATYVIGRVIGKTGWLDRTKAQKVAEYIVIGAFVGALVIVTLVYS